MTDLSTVIHLLDEARGFAALSPAGRENISEAIDILEALNTRPAAPVEGLEEIVKRAMQDEWEEICADTDCHPLDIEQLGRRRLRFSPNHWASAVAASVRSQAEAIIAAKDESIKDAKLSRDDWKKLAKDIQADNAALTAQVKELEQERAMIVSHATGGGTDGAGLSVNDISIRVTALRNELYHEGKNRAEALETKLAAARKALARAAYGFDQIHKSLMSNGPKHASGEVTAFFLAETNAALEDKP